MTSDGAGDPEFEAAFGQFYNKYRLSPTVIYASSQELVNITKKVIGNGGAPLLKINANINAQTNGIAAGAAIGKYYWKQGCRPRDSACCASEPAGRHVFYTAELPYAVANVTAVARMLMRQGLLLRSNGR